jgi:hypothetical protein
MQFDIPNITEAKQLGKSSDATFDDTVDLPYTTKYDGSDGIVAIYSSVPIKAFDKELSHCIGFLVKPDFIMLQCNPDTLEWSCLAAYNKNNAAFDMIPDPFQLVVLTEDLNEDGLWLLQSRMLCSNFDIKDLINNAESYYTAGGTDYFFKAENSILTELSMFKTFGIPTTAEAVQMVVATAHTVKYPLNYVATAISEVNADELDAFYTSEEMYYDESGSLQGLIFPANASYVALRTLDNGATWEMYNVSNTTTATSMANFGNTKTATRLAEHKALMRNANYTIKDLLTHDAAYYSEGGTDNFMEATFIEPAEPVLDDLTCETMEIPTAAEAKQLTKTHDPTFDDTLDIRYAVRTSFDKVMYSSEPIVAFADAYGHNVGVLTPASVIILKYLSGVWSVQYHYNRSDTSTFASNGVIILYIETSETSYSEVQALITSTNSAIKDYIKHDLDYYETPGNNEYFFGSMN